MQEYGDAHVETLAMTNRIGTLRQLIAEDPYVCRCQYLSVSADLCHSSSISKHLSVYLLVCLCRPLPLSLPTSASLPVSLPMFFLSACWSPSGSLSSFFFSLGACPYVFFFLVPYPCLCLWLFCPPKLPSPPKRCSIVLFSFFQFLFLHVLLSLCRSVGSTICRYVCLSVCLSVYLPVCLSVYLANCLSVCLFICLFICLSICVSVCLSVCLSACMSVCLSVCVSVLCVCLSLSV